MEINIIGMGKKGSSHDYKLYGYNVLQEDMYVGSL